MKNEFKNLKKDINVVLLQSSPVSRAMKLPSNDVVKNVSILNDTPVRESRTSSAQFGHISTEIERYSSDNDLLV
jgi:hypothetical protein